MRNTYTCAHNYVPKLTALTIREDFQYGTETEIEDKTLSELKDLCQKAIEETKKILYKHDKK